MKLLTKARLQTLQLLQFSLLLLDLYYQVLSAIVILRCDNTLKYYKANSLSSTFNDSTRCIGKFYAHCTEIALYYFKHMSIYFVHTKNCYY